jgi:small-conductance mechanosensitive channel
MMKSYRGLSITTLVLFALSSMEQGFLGPISYISKLPVDVIWQWVFSAFCLSLTLLLNRVLCQEFIHGYLERRLNTKIPALIDSLVEGVVILISVCVVMSLIFGRDISALLATLAGSAALLGFALKDFAVAFFTGIVLNVEKSFRVGDSVRIGAQAGTVEQITWRNTVLLTPELVSISIPNASIFNQTILNLDLPDSSSQRMVEVVISNGDPELRVVDAPTPAAEPTDEELEAYQMKKRAREDPMADFLSK